MLTVIKKIKPSDKEIKKVNLIVNDFLTTLKKSFPELKAELAGSFAKDTWLAGDHDIDVFIMFPYKKNKDRDISKILEAKLRNALKVHGSRDYFQVQYRNYLFELIPVLAIKKSSQAKNITDISPLHTIWVKSRSTNYADEIRLVKQFLKANNLYGAESYIRGFSGYLVEVLTIHYKGFFNLIKAASSWKEQEIIDMEKHYKTHQEAMKDLNKSKHGNLIVIDPVQASRNVAAALSKEKYLAFINLCNKFLHHPSTEFFEKKQFSLLSLKELAGVNHLLYIELKPLEGKKDIIGSKLLKVFTFLKERMEINGFTIKDAGWEFDKIARFWIITENSTLPEKRKHYGPFKTDKPNLHKFMARWNAHQYHEEAGRVYVLVKREYRTAVKFAKHVLQQDYCRENYKKMLKIRLF